MTISTLRHSIVLSVATLAVAAGTAEAATKLTAGTVFMSATV